MSVASLQFRLADRVPHQIHRAQRHGRLRPLSNAVGQGGNGSASVTDASGTSAEGGRPCEVARRIYSRSARRRKTSVTMEHMDCTRGLGFTPPSVGSLCEVTRGNANGGNRRGGGKATNLSVCTLCHKTAFPRSCPCGQRFFDSAVALLDAMRLLLA